MARSTAYWGSAPWEDVSSRIRRMHQERDAAKKHYDEYIKKIGPPTTKTKQETPKQEKLLLLCK